MEIWIIASLLVLVVVSIILLWKFIVSKKKLMQISNELQFFKKEKEYYDEAMIMFTSDNKITFANEAAKDLFSLNDENERYGISKKVQLRVKDEMPEDFF